MAAFVQNGQLSTFTLPAKYGNALVPGVGGVAIADTPDNVVAALGGAALIAQAGISVSLIPDGTPGAINIYPPVNNQIVARFATTAGIVLATTALTAIDGVTPVAGDIALVKNQGTASQNGLYVVSTGPWVRVNPATGGSVLVAGMLVSVVSGTANTQTTWSLGANLTTWTQLSASGVSAVSLASNANGAGASLVGIEDAAGLITATTVEGALAELVKYQVINLADPGTGAAIPVTRSAYVGIVTAGAETNTLAIPTFIGQQLILNMDTRVGGDRVVTCAQAINQAGNTIMTFGAARDVIVLEAIKVGGAFRWTVTGNDGVALS